jgi:GNAT superfamily N-acetyltransferase
MPESRSAGGIVIRPLREDDSEAVRAIAYGTGFFGSSMKDLVDDRRIFDRSLDLYLDPHRSLGFAAEEQGGAVVGYAVGSRSDPRLPLAAIAIAGTASELLRWRTLTDRDRSYLVRRWRGALDAVTGEARRFRVPSGPRLHVNLLDRARGCGAGSRLVEALIGGLAAAGARRVHANAWDHGQESGAFWKANGFSEYSRARFGMWSDLLGGEQVDLVCWLRPITPPTA